MKMDAMTAMTHMMESLTCHRRINLCQPGLSVRQPKKKNWYTPKPSSWQMAQLVHADTQLRMSTPAVPTPRIAAMK